MYLFSPYTPISSDAVDCGTPYFPDCEPSWSTCQFCGAIHCIRCHDYDECLPGQVAKDPTAALGVCVQCGQSFEVNEGEEDSCLLGEGVRERLDRSCPGCKGKLSSDKGEQVAAEPIRSFLVIGT